jgi:DNA-binding LacI/PurR family transcriptional regulator
MSIVDVAKVAEVSTATVSRVLNAPESVRAETADRVHAAMQTLGYSLPAVRRGPKNGSRSNGAATKQIAVVTFGQSLRSFEQPGVGAILTGITRAAWDAQLRVLLQEVDPVRSERSQSKSKSSAAPNAGEIGGAIILAPGSGPMESVDGIAKHLPMVWIAGGRAAPMKSVDQIWTDDSAIGSLAYQQLADKGCRRFICLCDQPEISSMRARSQSFAHAAGENSHPAEYFLIHQGGRLLDSYGPHVTSAENLEQLVRSLAENIGESKDVGLFLPSDLLAAQTYPLLYQNQLQPGRDLMVATVANEAIRCGMLIPEPLSIDIGCHAIGGTAVERLLHRMQHPADPPMRTLIAPSVNRRH